jgi:hypothetical protein
VEAVRVEGDVVAAGSVRELEAKVGALERLLGRETMTVEILREALDASLGRSPACGNRRRLRLVPDESRGRHPRRRPIEPGGAVEGPGRYRSPYQHEGNDVLLAEMRPITDTRPTDGYLRDAALLNRARRVNREVMA